MARPLDILSAWSMPSPSKRWYGPRGRNCGFGPFRMYAPSRQGGRTPWMISHSVGGSSSTGAKFSESVNLGSTEGLLGGSM